MKPRFGQRDASVTSCDTWLFLPASMTCQVCCAESPGVPRISPPPAYTLTPLLRPSRPAQITRAPCLPPRRPPPDRGGQAGQAAARACSQPVHAAIALPVAGAAPHRPRHPRAIPGGPTSASKWAHQASSTATPWFSQSDWEGMSRLKHHPQARAKHPGSGDRHPPTAGPR